MLAVSLLEHCAKDGVFTTTLRPRRHCSDAFPSPGVPFQEEPEPEPEREPEPEPPPPQPAPSVHLASVLSASLQPPGESAGTSGRGRVGASASVMFLCGLLSQVGERIGCSLSGILDAFFFCWRWMFDWHLIIVYTFFYMFVILNVALLTGCMLTDLTCL